MQPDDPNDPELRRHFDLIDQAISRFCEKTQAQVRKNLAGGRSWIHVESRHIYLNDKKVERMIEIFPNIATGSVITCWQLSYMAFYQKGRDQYFTSGIIIREAALEYVSGHIESLLSAAHSEVSSIRKQDIPYSDTRQE